MKDTNQVIFGGTIDRLKRIDTKTGIPMATFLLIVGKDKFKCVSFKNVADAIMECKDGDPILVTGTGSINSWKDDGDSWHNDFQVTAWAVEVDGKTIAYDRGKYSSSKPTDNRQKPSQDDSQYAYQGGPF